MTCTSPSQKHRDEGLLAPASLWVEAAAPSGSSDTVLADGNAQPAPPTSLPAEGLHCNSTSGSEGV